MGKMKIGIFFGLILLIFSTSTTNARWCHDFKTDLSYKDSGAEVSALQTALQKEGFYISSYDKTNKYFGAFTAAAVSGFQQKYKDEILTPPGFKYGTGIVSEKTRNKLNQLYQCPTGFLTPLPPSEPEYDYECYNWTETFLDNKTTQIYDDSWIFQPINCATTKDQAPVAVYLHGWGNPNIEGHKDWLEHLVKKGNIVIFPVYEEYGLENLPSGEWYIFVERASESIKMALSWLQNDKNNVQPDLNKFAMVGGSMGAYITINLASIWEEKGLPEPKAILLIHPPEEHLLEDIKNPENIPSTILMNCFVGDEDNVVGRKGCDLIWKMTRHILKRDYVWECSDYYGKPPIKATHKPGNVIKWYAYWKTMGGLMDCAFYNKNCAQGLGNTPAHKFMGLWSDNTLVKQLSISNIRPISSPCQ